MSIVFPAALFRRMALLKMKLSPAVLSGRPMKVVGDVLPSLLLLLGILLYCTGCSSFSAGRSRVTGAAPETAAGIEVQVLLALKASEK
ncbi:MAG: hypothetical protein P8X90_30575 [Desulfobacterales bacterium]